MRETVPIKERLDDLRIAAKLNPFDHNSRTAGANLIAVAALLSHDPAWIDAAKNEISYRIETDSTDATLLLKGVMLNLETGDDKRAQIYFDQFKRVARASPLIELVEKAHQKGQ